MLVSCLIVAAVYLADRGNYLTSINDRLGNFRSAQAGRAASGDFVFVAIDATSIRQIGQWPWSRQVHADLLDNLTSAGALDVFFDVDFAFASDAVGDAAFADALDRFGSAYLPVFQQSPTIGDTGQMTNVPYHLFAERSWPALVNVLSDDNGRVRYYPYGAQVDGDFVPSAAALLTGRFTERSDSFPINLAFQPGSVPILSAVDVAAGQFDPDMIAGRSIIVGASAIELGDFFTVPVHGIIPGALVHVLAAETLASNSVPVSLSSEWILIALLALLLFFQTKLFQAPVVLISASAITILISETVAFVLFAERAVMVPTAAFYPSLLMFCGCTFLQQLKLNRWVIQRQRQEVANTSALLCQVFNDSFDAVAIVDESGLVQRHSDSAASLFGVDDKGRLKLPERLMGDALCAMQSGGDRSVLNYETVSRGKSLHLEYTVTPSQTISFERANARMRRIATLSMRDVTQIKEQQREIAYLSSYDALTGALRRRMFVKFLELRAAASEPFTIYVFNLSRFKTINVVLGRDVGDTLLQHVVMRLQETELNVSAIARLGSDTFACFTEFSTDDAQASAFAQSLCDVVARPYDLGNANARVGVKLGYSIVEPTAQFVAADALSHAEEALDVARASGETEPRIYTPVLSNQQFRSRKIERSLVQALDSEEFEVWYQPQHRLSDQSLVGSEALLRWNSETFGQIYPDEFIRIAESTGFINELGAWVMNKAMTETMALPGTLGVAVNVSGIQMAADGFVEDVNRLLRETRMPASRLTLELTETVLLDGTDDIVEKMRDIQFRGVSWALDDFGTGYSSLGYLSHLPLDKLKVDKSFLKSLGTDPSAEIILTAIADLCGGLGMDLLFEGVETEEHVALLNTHPGAEAQGYHFGKPMPFSEFFAYVQSEITQQTSVANTRRQARF